MESHLHPPPPTFTASTPHFDHRYNTISLVLSGAEYRILACGWRSWWNEVGRLREIEAACKRVAASWIERIRHGDLHAAFDSWLNRIWKQQQYEHRYNTIALVLSGAEYRILACGWRSWWDEVGRLREIEAACKRVAASWIERIRHGDLRAAFDSWLDQIRMQQQYETRQTQARLVGNIVGRLLNNLAGVAFTTWIQVLEEQKKTNDLYGALTSSARKKWSRRASDALPARFRGAETEAGAWVGGRGSPPSRRVGNDKPNGPGSPKGTPTPMAAFDPEVLAALPAFPTRGVSFGTHDGSDDEESSEESDDDESSDDSGFDGAASPPGMMRRRSVLGHVATHAHLPQNKDAYVEEDSGESECEVQNYSHRDGNAIEGRGGEIILSLSNGFTNMQLGEEPAISSGEILSAVQGSMRTENHDGSDGWGGGGGGGEGTLRTAAPVMLCSSSSADNAMTPESGGNGRIGSGRRKKSIQEIVDSFTPLSKTYVSRHSGHLAGGSEAMGKEATAVGEEHDKLIRLLDAASDGELHLSVLLLVSEGKG